VSVNRTGILRQPLLHEWDDKVGSINLLLGFRSHFAAINKRQVKLEEYLVVNLDFVAFDEYSFLFYLLSSSSGSIFVSSEASV
jgi:hypothetical protein